MTENDDDTAGAGSPAPAVSSADVVAAEARVELERVARRWGELPLARAQARIPVLRAALTGLASRSAAGDVPAVPDLGPAVVLDQLTVLVWDAYAAGHGDGIPDLLTELRHTIG